MSSNPNQTTPSNEGGAPPAAPFDPAQALLNQLSQASQLQAHAQAGQAAQSQLLHPYLQALNWGASNPLTLMLAQQQQMQLLQQQAALGLFLPSPTHSSADAAAQFGAAALAGQPSPDKEPAVQSNLVSGANDAANTSNEAKDGKSDKQSQLFTPMKKSPPEWHNACIPLGVKEDKLYLSELQCILREEFVECFGAGKKELTASSHGRTKPLSLGQVGLRCTHCKHIPMSNRSPHSYTYPAHVASIYTSAKSMFRLHFNNCKSIPAELKAKVSALKDDQSNRVGRKQYWLDSAKRIGLIDVYDLEDWSKYFTHGITFSRDPHSPLPPLEITGQLSSLDEDDDALEEPSEDELSVKIDYVQDVPEPEHYPLVLPEDKPLITDYLYLALEQMTPTNLQESDRVGCYKGRRTGFPGLACKHCVGQAGCGRYFPASEASLSQTTTSQTLVNHVRNCRRCPIEVREELELMKRVKHNYDSKNHDNKPRHGGRKVFFHRLWCRIQRIPLPKHEKIEDSPHSKTPIRERSLSSPSSSGKKRKKSADIDNDDVARKSAKYDDDDRDFELDSLSADASMKDYISTAFQGSVRLTRGDDPHWLSDACCFIRKELVEVFTAEEEDLDDTNCSLLGQVGVRCVHCAQKPIGDRPKGHVYFPASIAGVQDAVADLHRRHLQLCTEIPLSIRATYRSMKGFESKLDVDTAQYWVDSAKELGLCDYDGGPGEVMFFRNPNDPSPADEIDVERKSNMPTGSFVVRAEDRATCTDHILLLLKQFKPCRFELSDRRGGIAKSRDRPINFPGLQCMHCNHKRYFPIAEKKVSDTTNLMMTHITNCFGSPLDVKASLCYLQHRSLIQKAELMGNWKITFFKRVWDRLHHHDWGDGSSYVPEIIEQSPPAIAAAQSTEDNGEDGLDMEVEESFVEGEADSNHANEMEKMRPLIRAAALWLSEQDANAEARVLSGRGIGTIQTVRARSGRGRGGGRGRGIRRRLSS